MLKGYEGTSVKEITDKARVSVSAINYHFESKENLYAEIVTCFAQKNLHSITKTLTAVNSQEELKLRIEFFIGSLLDFMFDNYAQTMLVLKQVDLSDSKMQSALAVFMQISDTLNGFLKSAQERGFIRSNVNVAVLANLLFNHIASEVKHDEFNEGLNHKTLREHSYRSDWIRNTISIIFEGAEP